MAFDLVARLKLQDDFSSQMRKVTEHMSKAERATSKLTSGVGKFTTQVAGIASAIGVTAAVASGFDMIRESVGRAFHRIDTMEQFERVMTTMTGSQKKANDILAKTNEIVTGTAYGLDVGAQAVQSFITSYMDVNKATDTLAAWGDAVAFYGDGSNETFASVSDAISKMTAKGKVQMDTMNRFTEAGIPAMQIYADATGQSVEDVALQMSKGMLDAEEFTDVMNDALMNGTKNFAAIEGAAKEAGASWAGSFDNMRAAIARGVTSIIQSIDEILTSNGLPDMRQMIANFGKSFEQALKKVAAAIPPVVGFIKQVYDALEPWHPMLKKIAIGIATAFGAIASFMAFVGVFKAIGLAIGFLTSPVGLIVLGITALAVAFQTAYEKSEVFRQKVDGIIQTIKGLFSGETGTVDLLAAIGFSPEQIEKITGFIETVKTSISEFKEFILAKFLEIQPGIQTLIDTFSTAEETVSVIFNTLLSVASSVLSALGSAFQILADVAVMVFNNVIVPTISLVWTYFQMMWSVIGPILQLLGAAIQLAFEVLKIVWDTIIKPVASYLLGEFKTALESAQPLLDTLASAFQWLGDKISAAAGFLSDLADRLSSIKMPSWLGKLGSGVASFVFGGGGGGRGGAPARHYHGIDYVPSDGYKAVLHKGEAVITAQENKERKKGGNNVTINMNGITIREEADIDRLMNAMVRKLQDAGGAGA